MRVVFSNVKQSLFNKQFLISIFVLTVIMIFPSLQKTLIFLGQTSVFPDGYFIDLFFKNSKSQALILLVPILVTIPCSTSYIDDIENGFIKLYVLRTNKNIYVLSKIISSFLVGTLIVLIASYLSYFLTELLFHQFEISRTFQILRLEELNKLIPRLCLFGSLCSCIGLSLGTIINNRYVAFSSAFVFVYSLVIITERYTKDVFVVNPKEWILLEHELSCTNEEIVLFLLSLLCITCISFYFEVQRRMREI